MTTEESLICDKLYESTLRIRIIEEVIAEEYPKQEMKTPSHFCIGQEAIAAGVCTALRKDDFVHATYRSHGWYLAKGGDLDAMIAEMYGRSAGCSRGFGGSMHLIDLAAGFEGTSALVGQAIPHAVGAGFAFHYQNSDRVSVSVFGDGATEEGIFQESIMFAVLRNIPVIFVCENNKLATHSPIELRQPPVPIHVRAAGMGIHSVRVDGNDAFAVYQAAHGAVERARSQRGPTFIECETYRVLEHVGPCTDFQLGYRSEAEGLEWAKRDPLLELEKRGGYSADHWRSLRARIRKEAEDSIVRAKTSLVFPDSLIPKETLWQ